MQPTSFTVCGGLWMVVERTETSINPLKKSLASAYAWEGVTECFHVVLASSNDLPDVVELKGCRPGSYPCHLILGNKNPCYVDQHYDIAITTQRIAWAQFHNAGKSLVAPDFLLCHVDIKERLLEALKTCITRFYGCDESHSFGRIVNMEVFNHTIDVLWRSGKVAVGGQIIETEKYIGKLNLYLNEANRWSHISNHLQVTESDPILQQDIFSLVLTVLSINDMERPPYKDRNLSLMTWARTLSQRSQGWCQIL